MILSQLDVLDAIHTAAIAREVSELATLNNAMQTAADNPNPAFSEAADRAAAALISTRAKIAGLATLIAEMTPQVEGEAQ